MAYSDFLLTFFIFEDDVISDYFPDITCKWQSQFLEVLRVKLEIHFFKVEVVKHWPLRFWWNSLQDAQKDI